MKLHPEKESVNIEKNQCEEAVMVHEVVAQHHHCALLDVQLTKKNLQTFKKQSM